MTAVEIRRKTLPRLQRLGGEEIFAITILQTVERHER
jgi:hypothetical protein